MNKLERDGKIAVLVTSRHGAGWSTWNDKEFRETLCMDSEIVQAILDGDKEKAVAIAMQKCDDILTDGIEHIQIEWVKKGESFEITEYGGMEHIHVIGSRTYMVA